MRRLKNLDDPTGDITGIGRYLGEHPDLKLKSVTAEKLSQIKVATHWVAAPGDARDEFSRFPSGTKWILVESPTPVITIPRPFPKKYDDWLFSLQKQNRSNSAAGFPNSQIAEKTDDPFSGDLLSGLRWKSHPKALPINELKLDSKIGNADLTPFVEVNNRLSADFTNTRSLVDIQAPTGADIQASILETYRNQLSETLKATMKPTLAMSSAKLADGSYMVSLFDIRRAAFEGRLVGQVYTIPAVGGTRLKELAAALQEKLAHGSHLYVYGDVPQSLALSSVVSRRSAKVVRRSKWTQHNILGLEERLQQLSSTPIDAKSTVIVNALPATKEDTASFGPLAGNSETWIDFHQRVSDLIDTTATSSVEPDKLFSELNDGQKNVVFIVAHSTGLKLFLGSRAISIADLRKLDARADKSAPPRMAVLLICNAGEEKTPPRWSFFHKDLPNLADTLLSKRFFDVVIAPDHPIQADETVDILQRLSSGGTNAELPAGWTRRSSVPRVGATQGG